MSLLFTNNFKVLQKGGLSVALINPYLTHYENMPMQYIENFLVAKIEIFIRNVLIFFLFLLQNIDCGYSLEPPRRGVLTSNRLAEAVLTSTHNLCFGAKIRKISIYPCIPQFYYIKVGYEGVYITRTCFPDVMDCPIIIIWVSPLSLLGASGV